MNIEYWLNVFDIRQAKVLYFADDTCLYVIKFSLSAGLGSHETERKVGLNQKTYFY